MNNLKRIIKDDNILCIVRNGMDKLAKRSIILLFTISLFLLAGCTKHQDNLHINKVGMIVEGSIDEEWNQKGYKGLEEIKNEFDVNVLYEENIRTESETIAAVDQLIHNGANLIFGHGNHYGRFFVDVAEGYPDVHFVYFNGGYFNDHVTSMNFNSYAMGFFGGMVASEMTETKHVGIIASYEWQPEIEGFYEGVKYQDSTTKVHVNYVNKWNETAVSTAIYDEMQAEDVDVIYPTGETYSQDVIAQASKDGVYAIGYGADQAISDDNEVLTSMVQHIDKLYLLAARKFNEQELEGGFMTFDFQDNVITLGDFSPDVPVEYQEYIAELVDKYAETNLLPHED